MTHNTGRRKPEGKSNQAEQLVTVAVPLRWEEPDDVKTTYANQVYVTHAGPEFYLVFGEMRLPHAVEKPPEEIPVKVVSRVALTPEIMEQLLAIVEENYGNYQRKQELREQGENK